METLKYDNNTINAVKNAMSCYSIIKGNKSHIMDLEDIDYFLKKELMSKFSQETINTTIGIILTENSYECEFICKVLTQIGKIQSTKSPILIKDLDINDLKALGYNGEEIGEALILLQKFVWQYPEHNKKETLIKRLKQ